MVYYYAKRILAEGKKLKIGSVLLIVFLIAVAVTFIYVTVRINSLEQKSRDKSSEIDGCLWDRAFQLSKLVALLTNKGIEHSIEALDVNTFGLGMSATLQATYSEKMDVQDVALRELLKEHKEVLDDPEFKQHLEKFNVARTELFKASVAYNKCTNEFNSSISGFPSSWIAAIHKKSSRNLFGYYFRNLDD